MNEQLSPQQILRMVYEKANATRDKSAINNVEINKRVDYVCHCISNRAGVRLLMACLLAKLHKEFIDPRKPYTEIESNDSFSGRHYDEGFITPFINEHRLPCNQTTAFLTPTLRNINRPLTTNIELVGRPRELYTMTLVLLEDVAQERITAEKLFVEVVRVLLNMRDEKLRRISSLIETLKRGKDALPLSTEQIVKLIEQHLSCKNSSRLPVLIVASAYQVVGERFGERILPLNSHNAADLQTGAFGDIEICLVGDNNVVSAYEMKMKRITIEDIQVALTKIKRASTKINNYVFITTDIIEREVSEYAAKLYDDTGGTEIVILDCIGFLRHFLHFFHRLRTDYLDAYQLNVLNEPDSAVSQTLKEAFLALRQVAESGE